MTELEISVREASTELKARPDTFILDVREPFEREIVALPGSTGLTEELLRELIENGERSERVLTICHHGERSLEAAQFLKANGFSNVVSIEGGIHAWALEIDPSLATY